MCVCVCVCVCMKLWHKTIIGQEDEGNFCETWSMNRNYWSEVENAVDGRNDISNGKKHKQRSWDTDKMPLEKRQKTRDQILISSKQTYFVFIAEYFDFSF